MLIPMDVTPSPSPSDASPPPPSSPSQPENLTLLEGLRRQNVRFVTFLYFDVYGKKYGITYPLEQLSEEVFAVGISADTPLGTVRIMPQRNDFFILPWSPETVFFLARTEHRDDPHQYLEKTLSLFSQESGATLRGKCTISFNVFSSVSYLIDHKNCGVSLESVEMTSTGKNYPIEGGEELHQTIPHDSTHTFRTQLSFLMQDIAGKLIESHYHGSSFGGCAVQFREAELVDLSSASFIFKIFAKSASLQLNSLATFMPKPLSHAPGNTYSIGFKAIKDDVNLFGDETMSDIAKGFIGGILSHAASLCVFTNPTTNSYRRLHELSCGWSTSYERAIVLFKHGWIYVTLPDPSCVPPLAIAAVLLAGMDGIARNLEPGGPVEKKIIKQSLPANLKEAVEAVEEDNAYLSQVFDASFLGEYFRRKKLEYSLLEKYPHPIEFKEYLDV